MVRGVGQGRAWLRPLFLVSDRWALWGIFKNRMVVQVDFCPSHWWLSLEELCNIRSQNRDPVYLLSSRLSSFKQICSGREGENASSLLLTSENLFGRYHIANFPLTLSALWLSSPRGSIQFCQYMAAFPSTTADVCTCIKDEGGWSPALTLKSKATQGTEGRNQGSCKREQSGACKRLSSEVSQFLLSKQLFFVNCSWHKFGDGLLWQESVLHRPQKVYSYLFRTQYFANENTDFD